MSSVPVGKFGGNGKAGLVAKFANKIIGCQLNAQHAEKAAEAAKAAAMRCADCAR